MAPMYPLADRGLAGHFVRNDGEPQPTWESIEQIVVEVLLFGRYLVVFLAKSDSTAMQIFTTFLLCGLSYAGIKGLLRLIKSA